MLSRRVAEQSKQVGISVRGGIRERSIGGPHIRDSRKTGKGATNAWTAGRLFWGIWAYARSRKVRERQSGRTVGRLCRGSSRGLTRCPFPRAVHRGQPLRAPLRARPGPAAPPRGRGRARRGGVPAAAVRGVPAARGALEPRRRRHPAPHGAEPLQVRPGLLRRARERVGPVVERVEQPREALDLHVGAPLLEAHLAPELVELVVGPPPARGLLPHPGGEADRS